MTGGVSLLKFLPEQKLLRCCHENQLDHDVGRKNMKKFAQQYSELFRCVSNSGVTALLCEANLNELRVTVRGHNRNSSRKRDFSIYNSKRMLY